MRTPTRPFNPTDYPRLTELVAQGHPAGAIAAALGYRTPQVRNALSRQGLRAAPMRQAPRPELALIPDQAALMAQFQASGLRVALVAQQLNFGWKDFSRELHGKKTRSLRRRKKLGRFLAMIAARLTQ